MADRNLEDNDIEPAPKLIEVVFQNCKGQVDQWVEPYLRITVERLHRAEKSYLKCLLIQVVGIMNWSFREFKSLIIMFDNILRNSDVLHLYTPNDKKLCASLWKTIFFFDLSIFAQSGSSKYFIYRTC